MTDLKQLIDNIIQEKYTDAKSNFHHYISEKIYELLIERNIVNQDVINKTIMQLSQNATNDNVKKWLKTSFRKYLLNNHSNVKKYNAQPDDPDWAKSDDALEISISPEFISQAREVVDYLNTVTGSINMNYEQAKRNAEIAQQQRLKQKTSTDELKKSQQVAKSGEEVIKDYEDGFKWVNLTTPEALKYESNIMKHCVGDETQGYASGIKSGNLHIISLRDKNNKPHVTIEIKKPNKIQQIKGVANSGVKPEYTSYVKDILKNGVMGIKFGEIDDLKNIGILEKNGIWYDMYRLPKNFKFDDDLYLVGFQIVELPQGLKVGGGLYLNNTPIKELPQGLEVGGDLILQNAPIKELPQDLEVGGDLILNNTQIKELPSDLKVGGSLNLGNAPIKELPQGLKVGRDLHLDNTLITELPQGLEVGGHLNLSGTQITELPQGLKVGGGLSLINTPIKELPQGLEVGGSLDLRSTQIKELPQDLEVGGSLYLRNTQIKELPSDLKVSGEIYISKEMKDAFNPGKFKDKIVLH